MDGTAPPKLNEVFMESNFTESIKWSKIRRKQKPSVSTTHEKWIVVTSVSMPTVQVKKLSTIKGWQLIVVADSKTPKDWKYD